MRIKQAHVSESLAIFRDGFKKLWELEYYTDPYAPCLFVGVYNSANDITRINDHKGFKLVLFGGADIPNVRWLKRGFHVVVDHFTYMHSLSRFLGITKFVRVAFKDYRDFKPEPLGDRIYCYQAGQSAAHKEKYGYKLLESVIGAFGEDGVLIGHSGKSLSEVKEMLYKPSFINLQFNPIAGFTTVLEMACIGRESISNYPAPFCRPFSCESDVIEYIRTAKTNPQLPERVSELAHRFIGDYSDAWLNTEYWV